ncbi:MAG: ferrichrome ABC transporter permease [Deltaproteobacteria bacterium]|nr:ferrichrome ABC transporter permease [Deltaproteobacteria bacterium]
MTIYALTIFLSAVLLFQVQLIIAKYILPWFGGTPAVWTTCMLFFQVMLTAGYAYSHGIVSRLSARRQSRVHLFMLSCSVILLLIQFFVWQSPILPDAGWKHTGSDMPIARVLGLLAISVGMPFFILSTTSTLLQAWFSRAFPDRSPYKLFALSNGGSLLGLLSYPFLVEPNFTLSFQAGFWFVLYVVFVLCCGFTALNAGRQKGLQADSGFRAANRDTTENGENGRPTWLQYALWLTLTAGASIVLLATTNQVSEEVAVIPFLWVLPLSIYLLTFILSFSSRFLYWRPLFVVAGIVIMFFVSKTMFKMLAMMVGDSYGAGIIEQVTVYYVALFICCMLCHGELVKLKPNTRYLTHFYLSVSIGGALGGIFVGIIAPYLFQGLWELYIGYFVCGLAVMVAVLRDRGSMLNIPVWGWLLRVPAMVLVILLAVGPFFLLVDRLPQTYRNVTLLAANRLGITRYLPMGDPNVKTIAMQRNFYGILRVVETDSYDPERHRRDLYHGQTLHGFQYMGSDSYRRMVTSYFTASSGIGRAIVNHPRYRAYNPHGEQLRVGFVGLGAGTLAAYGRVGDYYRIYEINPAMAELAASDEGYFSYVPDCGAKTDVVLGDARISMENEEDQRFDILALDAFSGDAPPVHLLTKEAFKIYLRHIREGGIIAVHITNRYIDFRPLVWKIADEFGLEGVHISVSADQNTAYGTDWMLLTKEKELFQQPVFSYDAVPRPTGEELDSIRMWTDDYSNLYQLLM